MSFHPYYSSPFYTWMLYNWFDPNDELVFVASGGDVFRPGPAIVPGVGNMSAVHSMGPHCIFT